MYQDTGLWRSTNGPGPAGARAGRPLEQTVRIEGSINLLAPILKVQVIARTPDLIRGTRQSSKCVSLDCFAGTLIRFWCY